MASHKNKHAISSFVLQVPQQVPICPEVDDTDGPLLRHQLLPAFLSLYFASSSYLLHNLSTLQLFFFEISSCMNTTHSKAKLNKQTLKAKYKCYPEIYH